MKNKVWFITGCSSGFGKALCKQLLARGEKVVATARNTDTLKDIELLATPNQLLVLPLDVTSTIQIKEGVEKANSHFGKIDVLINNAGFGQTGALEEVSEEVVRKSFDTNVFGLIEVTRAVLPHMRSQKSGHIINLSSVAGIAAIGGAGIYAATKFAVEGLSEALAAEVAPFNIKVSLIEPGSFRTEFASGSLKTPPEMKEYDESLAATRKFYKTIGGNQPGDPEKAVSAIIALVDHPHPPLRLVLGKVALQRVRTKIENFEKELNEWENITLSTEFDPALQ